MGAVTSLFLRKVVGTVREQTDEAALLASVGLDPAAPPDPSLMISDSAYYALLERIAHDIDDATDLPLRTGAAMHCDDYGAFGLAWKSAPTLRGSFARAERYWRLLTSVTEYSLTPAGPSAWFDLHRAGERRLGLRLSNEASLASVVSIIRQVTPGPFAPRAVHFRHPAPARTAAHRAWFGCPVIFGAERDGIEIASADLSARNRLGDEGISGFLLPHLDAELARLERDAGLESEVRDAVAQALSDGPPKLAAIARRLGMGERTLQRRLSQEGLSFQRLVDEARRALAEGLLVQSDYSLAEVAFLTGFSEQSAFTRAFRRWTSRTPAAFREQTRPG